MDKVYNPAQLESACYAAWEQAGYFAPRPDGEAAPYSIMLPPPNVTGSLHMGHAFQQTIMDALIRWRRMQGRRALWQAGTDHAGIATQMVVERQLAAQGQTRHDLGREAFLERIWAWKAESGGTITRQMRRLGASCDWSRERFTMDEGLSNAVREAFVRLYEDGLIYRGKRLVNWDPKLHTAISDLEVQNEEEQGHLWELAYPLADDPDTRLVVATTRPETMLGDTAVAVHPEDERYRHLIGRQVRLPITGRLVPIVADDYVDPAFGTGCVKITPAHDFNDYRLGQRHNLPLINILDRNAHILTEFTVYTFENYATQHGERAPARYAGLDRFAARKQLVAEAEAEGWLVAVKPHTLKVPRGDRSGVVIEPWLTDQWYVDAEQLAAPAIAAVEDGRIRFVPESYQNMYFAWMRNLQPWCISRQLWWGHRIPAWYDDHGQVYVGRNEAEVRAKYHLPVHSSLRQDEDVLDTWFSSALWTFSTLGWPDETPDLSTFHPTDVLVTGFDIIFFWVARMVMMTMHLVKHPDGSPQVPFRTVYVTGLIRDEEGQKMSKSKGNVLDPIDMIDGIRLEELIAKRTSGMMQPQLAEKIRKRTERQFPNGIAAHGTDALRFTLAALASTGRDINWDMSRLEGYRNFCNKLWNASRYVLMQCEGQDTGQDTGLDPSLPVTLSLADRWIVSRLQQLEAEVDRHFESFRFDLMAQALYEFIWNEYCDWYLELTKPALKSEDEAAKRGTRRTLVRVLEVITRLLHPLMPFLTEAIWQRAAPLAGKSGETVMLQPFPAAEPERMDPEAEAGIDWLKAVVLGIRRIRAEMDIAPGKPLPVWLANASPSDLALLEQTRELLAFLARTERIDVLADEAQAPESAVTLVGEMKLLIPLAGLIDKDAELKRLDKEIGKLEQELARCRLKLEQPSFTDKAPAAVVEQERARARDYSSRLEQLRAQRQRIEGL